MSGPPPSGPVDLARWRSALADVSGASFDAIATAGIQLEGSVFTVPVHGRDVVWRTLGLLESLHEEVRFVDEVLVTTSVHLAWEGRALGLGVKGMTMLRLDPEGRVARVVLYHRPFGAVLLLSASLADRLPRALNGHGPGNGQN